MAHDEQDFVDGWQTYSMWIDDIRDSSEVISHYDENPVFKQKLSSCQSNLERFELIWNDDNLRTELEERYKKDLASCNQKLKSRVGKSISESKRMRDLGNKSFKNNEFIEALKYYTQSIKYAPYPSEDVKDDSLALALANRSAALYSLTRYRLCLSDIDLAIKYGYPENNMFKLMIRKVKCLHILSVWVNGVEQIKDNLRLMLKSRDTKEFVKTEIQNMFDFLEQTQPEDLEKDELDVIDETTMKISNVSKTLSQAADCVEMSYDNDKGRYLMTNKDVSFGRLLVAETPFVCNLAPHNRDRYCYNCFSRLHSCGLGCHKCTQVLYCSEECISANAGIHEFECNNFLDFQDEIGVAYLTAHIMFKINFDLTSIPIYAKKNVEKKSLDDILKISPGDWPDLVYKNDYAPVLALMDHASDYDYDSMMGYTLTAAYLMIAMHNQFSVKVPRLTDKKTLELIGSVVLRHLLQLQTNLISILDQNLQDLVSVGHSISEIQERPIGVGIYPTISLFNHSCSPNIISIFYRNKFVARASKSLECGTEINYCYGPSVSRMSKSDRQQRLKEQYFFTCSCECCTENKENESRALLCPDCKGPVVYNQDLTNHCMKCHGQNAVDVKSHLKRLKDANSHLDKIRCSDMDCAQKFKELRILEANIAKLAYWRHPLFVQIKSELIQCAEDMDDVNLALKCCEEEQELCAKTYGEDSYESIMTRLKLINFRWQKLYYAIEDEQKIETRTKAVSDLKSLLSTVSDTKGKLKDLLASTNILGAENSFDAELKFLGGIQGSINKYLASLQPNLKITLEKADTSAK